jgi:hypothetical protein
LAPQPSTRRNRRPHDYWVHRGFTFQNVVLSIFMPRNALRYS